MTRLFFCCLLLSATFCFSQTSSDSLSGFSIGHARIQADLHGCKGDEADFFLKKEQRNFIKKKFKLETKISSNAVSKKFNPATTANLPCIDEDFETLPTGTLSSTAWTAQVSN